jgi:Sulfatase
MAGKKSFTPDEWTKISQRSKDAVESSNDETLAEKSPSRRDVLLTSSALVAASALGAALGPTVAKAADKPAPATGKQPNILVIFGDDIGMWNVGAYVHGMMGRTPSIDSLAKDGVLFTDHYGQPSCTARRAAFIMGQNPIRTGMTTVGIPGSTRGIQKEDPGTTRVSSERIIWETAMSICLRCMASMSGLVIFTI